MKTYLAGIQSSVQSSYSNNGKTTTFGRSYQKTINSQNVIGPPLTQWLDSYVNNGNLYPLDTWYNPNTGHLFVLCSASTTLSATNIWVQLYNFSSSNSWTPTYVGRVNMNFGASPAGAPVIKGFEVYESGGNITPIITITHATAVEGGKYICYNLTTASFTVGGSTAFPASSASQAGAMYFLQDSAALGVNHVATTAWGSALPMFSSNSSYNTKMYQANGTFALPQIYVWDLSVAPTVAGTITNGVSAKTTLYAGTSPSAYFTMGASNNGYSATNGDQVVLMTGTGAVPTSFTAWASGTLQVAGSNVYFVRDLQLVSGNYYFNLSTTAGGAAVVPTGASSGFTMMRAFGISSSMFTYKTGVLTAITGGTLVANTMNYCKPVSAPANTALQGQDCIAFQASTALYAFKISDLSSGVTIWPSLIVAGVANTGTGLDIVTPSTTLGEYCGQGLSGEIDNFIYVTNTSTYVAKQLKVAGSALSAVFGGVTNTWYEGQNPATIQAGAVALTTIHTNGGFLFACSQTVGQRGIAILDMGSDASMGYSAVVSPVISVPPGNTLKYINTLEQLFDYTDSLNFWIRSATTSTDASFSSVTLPVGSPTSAGVISNGWTSLKTAIDLSSYSFGPYVQFCITYDTMTLLANTPAQLQDIEYTVIDPGESADDFLMDPDYTTPGTNTPSYVAWQCVSIPSSLPSTLYVKMINPTTGAVVFTDNTTANLARFQYSTNGGTSWSALPSVAAAFTVGYLVRYNVATPPGLGVATSLRYQS